MFKIKQFSTGTDSTIGNTTVGSAALDLSTFELFVVVGPNGSGKSKLTECLSKADVRRIVTTTEAQPGETFLAQMMCADLLHRKSTDLMGDFTDLTDALSRAAGVVRLNDEINLLKRLITVNGNDRLTHLLPAVVEGVPHDIATAMEHTRGAEADADSAFDGSIDRYDLDTYNAIGAHIGGLVGKPWRQFTAIKSPAMIEAEDAIRPTVRALPGSQHVVSALESCRDIASTSRAIEPLRQAELAFGAATEEARNYLRPQTVGAVTIDALVEWIDDDVKLNEKRLKELETILNATNLLGNVRRLARELLEAPGEHGNCPVCSQSIEVGALLQRLDSPLLELAEGAMSPEEEILVLKRRTIKSAELKKKLLECREELKQTRENMDRERGRWMSQLATLATGLNPRTDWDAVILGAIADVQAKVKSVQSNDAWTSAVRADLMNDLKLVVSDVGAACTKSTTEINTAIDNDNRSIRQAQGKFPQLPALRMLLERRQALNDLTWAPTWEARAADGAKQAVLDQWIKAVETLIAERSSRLNATQLDVLNNAGVQQRFNRLIGRLPHPLLLKLRLQATQVIQVNAPGVATAIMHKRKGSSQLSEGYRVLVNLAALIAVSGYVSDEQEHRAGWLVIDEPTNGLDKSNREIVAEYLGSLTQEDMPRQIFITTFDEDFAKSLIKHAKKSRNVLEIRLEPWKGSPINAPELTPHLKDPS